MLKHVLITHRVWLFSINPDFCKKFFSVTFAWYMSGKSLIMPASVFPDILDEQKRKNEKHWFSNSITVQCSSWTREIQDNILTPFQTCVMPFKQCFLPPPPLLSLSCHNIGDIHQEEVWTDEESLWAECAMRLWDCPHHLQQHQQALPIRQHRHGQSVTEVHRVQRASWEQDQFWYCGGEESVVLQLAEAYTLHVQVELKRNEWSREW